MMRITVVEDDPNMVVLLRTLLEIDGYAVGELDGSGDVLGGLKRSEPDFILLDVNLKGVNGLDIVGDIRQDAALKDVTVIMTSGLDMASECVRAGANHFLQKPYMPDQLLKIIREETRV